MTVAVKGTEEVSEPGDPGKGEGGQSGEIRQRIP